MSSQGEHTGRRCDCESCWEKTGGRRRWDHRLLDRLDRPSVSADDERDEYLDWQR